MNTKDLKRIIKNRTSTGLTRDLINIPKGGHKDIIIQSEGKTFKLRATNGS